jgi:hypothetical protein
MQQTEPRPGGAAIHCRRCHSEVQDAIMIAASLAVTVGPLPRAVLVVIMRVIVAAIMRTIIPL